MVWLVKAPPNVRSWRIWKRRETPLASVTPLPFATLLAAVGATGGTLWTLLLFFTEAGAFVFGSGLAIVPSSRGASFSSITGSPTASFWMLLPSR